MKNSTLKEIALDLLRKYEEAQETVICEYSGSIDADIKKLKAKVWSIRQKIEAETAKEPRWIPVSKRLPEKPFGCLVTVWDTDPVTVDEFENILSYFVGWDGEQWNDADGEQCPFQVLAWMPLPNPYKEEE